MHKTAAYLNAKNYSSGTVHNYTSEMRYIFAFYNDKSPQEITRDDIIVYINFIKSNFGSGRDKCRMVAQCCSFFYKHIMPVPYVVPSAFYPRKEYRLPNVMDEEWVAARIADLLPAPYYHIVFSVPHEFNKMMLANRKEIFKLLFGSASETLLNHGKNKKYPGGKPGMIMVLHMWGQKLDFHVHVHCIVTGGGINDSGKWLPPKRANGKFLFPVSGMKNMYKAIFLRKLREISDELKTPKEEIEQVINRAGYKRWKVYAKPPFGGPEQVIRYLGRYTHKTAITHHRILAVKDGKVRFRYKDYADQSKIKDTELSEEEFLRRFEQHILPARFVRIKYYGLLQNHGKKERLQKVREQLGLSEPPPQVKIPVAISMLEKFGIDMFLCEKCKSGHYKLQYSGIRSSKIFPANKAPPETTEVENHE